MPIMKQGDEVRFARLIPSLCCWEAPKGEKLLFVGFRSGVVQLAAAFSLEAHVEGLDAVGEGTEGDEVDAGLGIRNHGVESDAAR